MDTNQLMQLMNGYKISYLLFYTAEIKLFDYLEQPISVEEIEKKIEGISISKLEMLLNLLVGIDVVKKNENLYFLEKESFQLLSSQSKTSIIHLLNLEQFLMIHHNSYEQFKNAFIKENCFDLFGANHKENMASTYGSAMDNGGRYASLQMARIARKYCKEGSRILDVGGGKGTYSIAIAKSCKDVTVDILEQEEMVPICKGAIEKEGLSNRIHARACNLLYDTLTETYNGIVISNVLHLYDRKNIEILLTNVAAQLEEDGILILHDFFLNNEHTGPKIPLLFTIDWLLIGADFNYSYEDIEMICNKLGLYMVEVKSYDAIPTSMIVLKKKKTVK